MLCEKCETLENYCTTGSDEQSTVSIHFLVLEVF